jgi:sensor histidine kinase YesM
MKSTIITILTLFLALFGFSSEQDNLSEIPWKIIVEMTKNNFSTRWEDNVSIKVLGHFSKDDSLMVLNAATSLNTLTQTIKLELTANDWGNLEIIFVDSTNEMIYSNKFGLQPGCQYGYTSTTKVNSPDKPISIANSSIAIRLNSVPDSARQNFITNQIAHALFPHYWENDEIFGKGKSSVPASIFLSSYPTELYPYYKNLIPVDQQIIKAVYSPNFIKLLPLAQKKYNYKILSADLTRYAHKYMVFPLVLAIFLLVGFIIFLNKKIGNKINNEFLKFNILALISLITLAILIMLYFGASDKIMDPYNNAFNWHNFRASLMIALILGLPGVNLIRLFEILVHKRTQHKYIKVMTLFLSTSLIPSIILFILVYITSHGKLGKSDFNIIPAVFEIFVIIGIIRALISFFILKEKEMKIETEVKLAKLQELKTKAELNALHSKINPHFLYNSLNSIAGLAKTDAGKTEHMALSLSKLFRYSINKGQSDWSTFEEELEMVKIYLDIEKVRFDDRLEFTIDLPEELKNVKVPRFIIQPLVENAIKHGVSKLTTAGKVSISIKQNDKWIEVLVSDNGPAFPEEMIPGFGLQSIYDKLEILYPNRFELHFLNAPNKQILIKLS